MDQHSLLEKFRLLISCKDPAKVEHMFQMMWAARNVYRDEKLVQQMVDLEFDKGFSEEEYSPMSDDPQKKSLMQFAYKISRQNSAEFVMFCHIREGASLWEKAFWSMLYVNKVLPMGEIADFNHRWYFVRSIATLDAVGIDVIDLLEQAWEKHPEVLGYIMEYRGLLEIFPQFERYLFVDTDKRGIFKSIEDIKNLQRRGTKL